MFKFFRGISLLNSVPELMTLNEVEAKRHNSATVKIGKDIRLELIVDENYYRSRIILNIRVFDMATKRYKANYEFTDNGELFSGYYKKRIDEIIRIMNENDKT